jgi:hypothetical protein
MLKFIGLSMSMPVALVIALLGCASLDAPSRLGSNSFEQDRQAILAMAGEYQVSFQFDETLVLDPEAGTSEPHRSGGYELVQVLEDRGEFISLQHILVVGEQDDPKIVKHWRQDWTYEDPTIHEYRGGHTWAPRELAPDERAGTWSQAVYQVDDSPRYESFGAWKHVGGHSYWESAETWRPLPRRETKRKDNYDVLVGKNRHTITPQGWAHEQENYKLNTRGETPEVIAWEHGLNKYERTESWDFAAAREYWQKTAPFWAQVRDAWNSRLAEEGAIEIDETEYGPFWSEILDLAQQYNDAELDEPAAVAALKENFDSYVHVRTN